MTTTVKADRRQEVAAAAYRIRHHVLNMKIARWRSRDLPI